MIRRSREVFTGQDCIRIDNGYLTLWASLSVGPRILGLCLGGSENVFASLPDLTVDCPGRGVYHFYGGHRLWVAPEDPPLTYLPDDSPVQLSEIDDGVCLTTPVEKTTGIQKKIVIRLDPERAYLTIEHSLTNHAETHVELAAWAITQFRTGGMALLPLGGPVTDAFGLTPNRQLALWPYTDLSIPQLHMGKHLWRLRAEMKKGAFKIGYANYSGWIAYLLGEVLFVKSTPYQRGHSYLDWGSSSECYCNADFLELESLSPSVNLAPAETITHLEQWALFDHMSLPEDETSILEAFGKLGLVIAG